MVKNIASNMTFLIGLLWSGFSIAGTIEKVEFFAKSLGVNKTLVVMLPSNYSDDTQQRYPVIYQLHGWGVTEDIWTSKDLEIQKTAERVGYTGIIVMPDGDRGLYINSHTKADYQACIKQVSNAPNQNEARESYCVKNADYENYLIKDVIPFIENRYRVGRSQQHRAIGGESAGGFSAMQIALRYPEMFSSVAVHSAFLSLLYDGPKSYNKAAAKLLTSITPKKGREELEAILGYELNNWRAYDPYSLVENYIAGDAEQELNKPPAIYFDCGTKDDAGFYLLSLHFRDKLRELNIDHDFHAVAGGRHDDIYFKSRSEFAIKHHMKNLVH